MESNTLQTTRRLGGDAQSSSQPFTVSSLPKTTNPLSSKVTAVLSTSYADSEFRQALSLLDDRGIINDSETRRQLRLRLVREAVDCNGEIINDFGKVADQLRRIGMTLDRLNKSFQDMRVQLGRAHEQAAGSLGEASSLMSQKADIETKQKVLSAFKGRFLMTEDEMAVLTLVAEPVDDSFFAALAKAKRVMKECEILLGFEHQTLGLELVEQASKTLNMAYQKLYKWTQREFRTLNLENPHLNGSIRKALRVLAERPSLFQNCLSFFAEARERSLSDSFFVALTGTLPSGAEDHTVKPIDMAAHDPLRYVGDMLAWTHSAAVSEREALEALFVYEGEEIAKGLKTGMESELWHLAADEGEETSEFDAIRALNELVDRGLSGVARILRQRVEQVIQSNEDIIPAYRLANLLGFYQVTFSRLLGGESSLLDSIAGAEAEALRQFRSLVRDHIATLQGDFQQAPADLRPPPFLLDSLKQLASIMATYESSFSAATDREADFQPILDEAFEPFLSGCENMARALENPAKHIFLINCYLTAVGTLGTYTFTSRRVQAIQDAVSRERKDLVDFQFLFFRDGSGLEYIFTAVGDVVGKENAGKTLRGMTPFQPDALSRASHMLDDFLPSALMDAIEHLKPLQDSQLAREITEEAAARFCSDYARLEEHLQLADEDITGGIEGDAPGLRVLFPRTTGEVKVLLS